MNGRYSRMFLCTDSVEESNLLSVNTLSHEIKRLLLLGRKVRTTLDSIFKSRDITLPTKVRLVKAMFFFCGHVWM